jgi:hypothetical protein
MQLQKPVKGPDCTEVQRDETGNRPSEAPQNNTAKYRVIELTNRPGNRYEPEWHAGRPQKNNSPGTEVCHSPEQNF